MAKPIDINPQRRRAALMPDLAASDLTVTVSLEVEYDLDVVLERDGMQRVYQLKTEGASGPWTGLVGTVIADPARRAWLHRELQEQLAQDQRQGWRRVRRKPR